MQFFKVKNEILVQRSNFQIFVYGEYKSFVLHHRMCISNVEILPDNS
jgi:hypothetical protein